MKIAVIGTGISGMSAAYLLAPQHDVTVYEKNDYIGGHSRTITLPKTGADIAVDTGFIVFNHLNYPLLTGLFAHLGVPTVKSDMSFGVSIANGWLEYSSNGLLGQPLNLLRPGFWRMVMDILTFNRRAEAYLDRAPDITLGQCLDEMKLGRWFKDYYLKAMGAAIWSCSVETILQFPARTFIQFFKNHGLLTVNQQPQWHTVLGGSRAYVERLTASYRGRIRLNSAVKRVERVGEQVLVHLHDGTSAAYDQVIMASHANQSLAMLANPTAQERAVLGAFTYQENHVVVHSDVRFMPKRRKCWASWVYLSLKQRDEGESVSLSYWMNKLQSLPTQTPVFVTLNAGHHPNPSLVHDKHVFSHPVFTVEAIRAQAEIPSIQGQDRIWYCGAWQRYGFHEDGLMSAVQVAQALDAKLPWL